jgi:hypothetical protein
VQVIISHGGSYDPALLDSIAASLAKAGLHERCGDLYQHLNRQQEALQAYRKGHAYRCGILCAMHSDTATTKFAVWQGVEWCCWFIDLALCVPAAVHSSAVSVWH